MTHFHGEGKLLAIYFTGKVLNFNLFIFMFYLTMLTLDQDMWVLVA
jgi:hypothetical protein